MKNSTQIFYPNELIHYEKYFTNTAKIVGESLGLRIQRLDPLTCGLISQNYI